MKDVFLVSSSHCAISNNIFFEHCKDSLLKFLMGNTKKSKVIFVPYADPDGNYDAYTTKVTPLFNKLGFELISLHEIDNPDILLNDSSVVAIFVGGGNSWLLNDWLHKLNLINKLHDKVNSGGIKYIGSSAGSVAAGKSIITTNDMSPIEIRYTDSLNIIPFQVNAHFVAGPLVSGHMGEPREERIRQVLVWNPDWTIIGLKEDSWIVGQDNNYTLHSISNNNAMIFNKGGIHSWESNSFINFDSDLVRLNEKVNI